MLPDRVHTPGPLEESTENKSGRPELAVADRIAELSTYPDAGAEKEIYEGSILLTVIVRWTWGAAA